MPDNYIVTGIWHTISPIQKECQKDSKRAKFSIYIGYAIMHTNGEFSCQMPAAQFRHEISPLRKIIYVAD